MTLVTFGILRGVAKVRSIAVPRFTSTYLRPLVSAVALICSCSKMTILRTSPRVRPLLSVRLSHSGSANALGAERQPLVA